ncbi:MAG: polysaccharide biosynthesis protein [Deltaproteobacteria bacterium]|nr:polysaccharide biosynthesis protein [Deltaproteobacteria bacterium]
MVFKRAFDLVAAAIGLLLLSPLLALVALAIKAGSPGPVFFRQVRVGRGGREFRILKFRTMVPDAPSRGAQITVGGDPRITRLGRLLRRSKLDELPQLLNVVAGEMSLVGPRPEVPKYVALYDDRQREVLTVRPGITDYASITYFDENTLFARSPDPERTYVEEVMPRKLEMNLSYLRKRSLVEDVRIILATVYLALQGVVARAGRPGQMLLDAAVVTLAFVSAYELRFEGDVPSQHWKQMVLLLPYAVLARVSMNFVFGVYRILWRYVSLYEVLRFVRAIGLVSAVFLAFRFFYPHHNPYFRVPVSIILLEAVLSFLGMVGLRFLRRWLHETSPSGSGAAVPPDVEKVLVVGAGDNGRQVARELRLRRELGMSLVGFVDDDPAKRGGEIEGRKVLGTLDDIAELQRKHGFSQVLLAISDLPLQRKRELVQTCMDVGVKARVLPGTPELISGRAQVAAVRDVRIEDLLGRPVEELTRDDPMLRPVYGGRRVLISGAGGSIGSELCRQIATLGPESLILVDKDENNLFLVRGELAWRFPDLRVEARVLDVRFRDRIDRAFAGLRPQVVLHAAAYKHVPLMEENPSEAVENNVLGSRNVAELALAHGVETFVMISTDKAVNPSSVMGATKRVAELIVRQLAERSGATRFASVRFGNVLGSRGSVIPIFREQIEHGGPVTVTHPDVTRFFMTIPEASQLVIKAGTLADKGEVFVLDMGQPIRIVDLARDMIRLSGFRPDDIPIRFTGLRPGEKLYEELLLDRDALMQTPIDKVFISRPDLREFDEFGRAVDRLIERARTAAPSDVRALLAELDIGLRAPDTGGAFPASAGPGDRAPAAAAAGAVPT